MEREGRWKKLFPAFKSDICRLHKENVAITSIYDWLAARDSAQFPRAEREAGVVALRRWLKAGACVDRSAGILGEILNSARVTIFIGVRQSDPIRQRDFCEGLDVETVAILAQLQNMGDHWVELEIIRVATTEPNLLESILNREETGDTVITVGSNRSNPMTELVWSRLCNVAPFQSGPNRVPFRFFWPDPLGFESHFRLSSSQLATPSEEGPTVNDMAQEISSGGYAFELNGRVRFIGQNRPNGEFSHDWGVIAAARREFSDKSELIRQPETDSQTPKGQERLLVALAGASGSGTWAASNLLVNGGVDASIPVPNTKSVLVAPVATTVHWKDRADNLCDRRTVSEVKLLDNYPIIWNG